MIDSRRPGRGCTGVPGQASQGDHGVDPPHATADQLAIPRVAADDVEAWIIAALQEGELAVHEIVQSENGESRLEHSRNEDGAKIAGGAGNEDFHF